MGTAGITVAAVLAMTLSVTPANGGALYPPQITINDQAGQQVDPHVDGDTSAYSNQIIDNGNFIQEIRYYDFATNTDSAIPNLLPGGARADDQLSDVDQGRIVFTRSTDHRAIMMFEVATKTLYELAYSPTSDRMGVAIGGQTAAFIDFSGGDGELMIYDLVTNVLTQVTDDAFNDENPAVSPDGNTIVWQHCESNCDIYRATRSGNIWLVSALTSSLLPERNADTNGSVVVFQRENAAGPTGTDVVILPLGGAAETVLEIPGGQFNPSVRGNVVAFESKLPGAESDIYVVELSSNRIFQITSTPGLKESLNDITVLPNGEIRLVWQAQDPNNQVDPNANIYGATFSLPEEQPLPMCRSTVLEATRFHSPTRSVDGDVTFSPAMDFAIPAALPVVAGNAGNKKAYLTIELANKTIECEYRSRSTQSHPSNPTQLALASSYALVSCGEVNQGCGHNGNGHDNGNGHSGNGGSYTAGTVVSAVSAHLHIQNGDTTQPMTRIRLVIDEACSASSTSSPLQAGNDLDGPMAAGCSSTGASLTPFLIAFAFLALMMRRPAAIRLVTQQEQRRLPR